MKHHHIHVSRLLGVLVGLLTAAGLSLGIATAAGAQPGFLPHAIGTCGPGTGITYPAYVRQTVAPGATYLSGGTGSPIVVWLESGRAATVAPTPTCLAWATATKAFYEFTTSPGSRYVATTVYASEGRTPWVNQLNG